MASSPAVWTLKSSCKPYKYSFAGQETVVADSASLSVTNPTAFESRPYIKLYGSGAVTLNISSGGSTNSWTISSVDEYIEIDSELVNCYKGTVLKNDTVTGDGFPTLQSGASTIACVGDVTRIEFIPRWCCL